MNKKVSTKECYHERKLPHGKYQFRCVDCGKIVK